MMAAEMRAKSKESKNDTINLLILISIASLLGVYLIASTVMVSKDGVFYIERAKGLEVDLDQIIKTHPPGYPFLILIAHKAVTLVFDGSSLWSWIYSAQSVTLFCRVFALIPLYYIGKLLIGSKKSFWAILILVLLPYPARFGSDALRDWPHILFLAVGFFFLLWGAKKSKWWMFGVTGLAAGLGHIIRPECAQLVIYGVLWLLVGLLLPKRNMGRPKLTFALFILLIGFAVPVGPYMKARGRILPEKLKGLISSSCWLQSERIQEPNIDNRNHIFTAVSLPSDIAKAIGRLIERISEHLMYFFVPALLLGTYSRFRRKSLGTEIEVFFMSAFILFNVIMMILLYYNYGYISRRHCLPLVVFTIFYVPIGLQILADWLRSKSYKGQLQTNQNPQLWFFILLAVGAVICLPKLVSPMRTEKQGYRDVAKWLKENTDREDVVAVPDKRISFYAERKGLAYESGSIPATVVYVVKIMKRADEEPNFGKTVREEHSLWVDKRKKGKKLVIYKVM